MARTGAVLLTRECKSLKMSVHQYKNIYVNGHVINLCLTELKCGCNQNNLDSTTRISSHGRISHNTGDVTALGTLGYQDLTSPRTRRFQTLKKRRMLLFPAVVKQSRGKRELQPPSSFALCSLTGGKAADASLTQTRASDTREPTDKTGNAPAGFKPDVWKRFGFSLSGNEKGKTISGRRRAITNTHLRHFFERAVTLKSQMHFSSVYLSFLHISIYKYIYVAVYRNKHCTVGLLLRYYQTVRF